MLEVDNFLNYLSLERNYSPCTIDGYGRDLKHFEQFFKKQEENLNWETIDSDIIRNWIEEMMNRGNSATSINRRLSALRSFYRYAQKRKIISQNPARCIKAPKRKRALPYFLKEKEMDNLLDKTKRSKKYNDTLAHTIIMVFYETGIRLSELSNLNDADVNYITKEIKVIGKRNKHRIIPFGEELYEALKSYRNQRNQEVESHSEAFFQTPKGTRMTIDRVREIVKQELSKVSSIEKKSPHVLRHTFATAMLNNKANLEIVKELLGQKSLSTTEIYTHVTFDQLKSTYKSSHPRV